MNVVTGLSARISVLWRQQASFQVRMDQHKVRKQDKDENMQEDNPATEQWQKRKIR